ncbi:hypothetical protein FPJ27_08595 [Burkholderia sp. MS455]|nr:hypothetical protein FPJ27_08405 [Burkholderia sp. MS455]QRR06452.1 hypothetical protein FPJ27_08465 [Burkholderia sp. MS455]QRR06467.1 hypothetical protein FPJ27_08595 [Burkholderia sp. MS455]
MKYGVVKTQKNDHDVKGGPVHWLRRGTFVRVTSEGKFGAHSETMYPVFAVPVTSDSEKRYAVRWQYLNRTDFYELPHWLGPFLEWFAPKFQRVREWLCLA